MRFSNLIPQLSALAILLGTASAAVEIRFYISSYSCSGSYNYWYNIPANTCYTNGPGTAASHAVEFFNIPSGYKGQVYNNVNGCSSYGGEVSSGTHCFSSGWSYSANWFKSSKKLARRDPFEDGPSSTGLQYVTGNGEIKRITCAPKDFETVNKLLEAGDYAALEEYPTGKHRALLQLILRTPRVLVLTDH